MRAISRFQETKLVHSLARPKRFARALTFNLNLSSYERDQRARMDFHAHDSFEFGAHFCKQHCISLSSLRINHSKGFQPQNVRSCSVLLASFGRQHNYGPKDGRLSRLFCKQRTKLEAKLMTKLMMMNGAHLVLGTWIINRAAQFTVKPACSPDSNTVSYQLCCSTSQPASQPTRRNR